MNGKWQQYSLSRCLKLVDHYTSIVRIKYTDEDSAYEMKVSLRGTLIGKHALRLVFVFRGCQVQVAAGL